jgi:berberine-like enzyme
MCVYANVLNFDEADRLIDAYGGQERYDRLARVKSLYDPDNFVRTNNAAIAPGAGRSAVSTCKEKKTWEI